MVKRCVFDEASREMAVELSYAKGSIQEAARELGVDPGRISKWRQRHKKSDQNLPLNSTLTDEQQQIRRLQRELREAQMDRTAEAARYTKEGGLHLLQDRRETFRFIKEHASEFPTVRFLCSMQGMRDKFYHISRPLSPPHKFGG